MLLIPQRHLSELMLWRCDPPARSLYFLGRRPSVNSRLGIFRESRALLKNSVLSGSFYPSPNHAPAPFPRAHPTNEAKGGIILPTRRGNTAAFAVSDASQTFWTMPVKQTPVEELSRSHLRDRMVDKRSRFAVRRRLREDGVVSNLFPLFFSSASDANAGDTPGAFLYVYDICATRRPYQNFDRSSALALPSHVIARRRVKAKQSLTSPPLGSDAGVEIRRVPPMNAWKVIRRFFNHFFSKSPPPMIQHVYKLYTIAPLPAKALKVPPEFYDLGWKNCELRFIAKLRYEDLNPHCLQEVVNKIVFWAICNTPALQEGEENENDPNNNSSGIGYRVVRERGGKLVNLAGGISSCGARFFSGVTAQAIFVDASDSEPSSTDPQTTTGGVEVVIAAPNSTDLATLPEGTTPTGRPIRFLAKSFLRAFTYKGREVESYTIEDASGAYLASFWEPPSPRPLQPGRVYTATALHVRIFPSRDHLRLFEFLPGRTTVTAEPGEGGGGPQLATAAAASPSGTSPGVSSGTPSGASSDSSSLARQLVLKLDPKGTLASETSVWAEVVQRHGGGPYDDDARTAITRALHGMPVVSALDLYQGSIRILHFPNDTALTSIKNTNQKHSHKKGELSSLPDWVRLRLDPRQPWAVISDHHAMPLQLLHCCFDPHVSSWQRAAIATFSMLPPRRLRHLQRYWRHLSSGLRGWGIRLAEEPLRTRQISVLPVPEKVVSRSKPQSLLPLPFSLPQQQALLQSCGGIASSVASFPTTVVILGVAGSRCSSEETNRIALTARRMATYFNAENNVACVESEEAAVCFVIERLLEPTAVMEGEEKAPSAMRLRDINTAVILITMEPDSRATRWVIAECLSRGILPVCILPATTAARASILCGNIRRQLFNKFERDPLRGVDLAKEVPVIAGLRMLFVGVDACHTNAISTGAVVGVLYTKNGNHLISRFWRQESRGREVAQLSKELQKVLDEADALSGGIDQLVIFQDGNVFSELCQIKELIAACMPSCGLTFMCLHKRSNIRFVYERSAASSDGKEKKGSLTKDLTASPSGPPMGSFSNLVKGVLIPALAPISLDYEVVAPTFYLQTHDCEMSTARIVKYTVHHQSPTLEISDVQQLANVMANIMSPQATKLPMSTRCAHRLADQAERLLDAVPQLRCEMIPEPVRRRLWFM